MRKNAGAALLSPWFIGRYFCERNKAHNFAVRGIEPRAEAGGPAGPKSSVEAVSNRKLHYRQPVGRLRSNPGRGSVAIRLRALEIAASAGSDRARSIPGDASAIAE
jgi:hypothetical protein